MLKYNMSGCYKGGEFVFGYKTFRGGIHPDDKKKGSNMEKIQNLDPPKIMVYPVQQHIGKPAVPVVKVGDEVKIGQLIAEADGYVSANVHASVSGKVVDIRPHIHPNGNMVNSIIVENDFKEETIRNFEEQDNLDGLSPEDIVKIVKDAGIVGMGGATFPTHVKLVPPSPIDTLLVNGAECEPYITSDHRIMLEHPNCILTGIKAVMKAIGAEKTFVGVESNKPDAIEKLNEIFSEEESINVVPVLAKYPQGSEKQMISVIAGKEVPSGSLPSDVGIVVLNIDTIWAIAEAITKSMPLMYRILTLSGGAVKQPKNYLVRIGTPAKTVIDAAGGFCEEPAKILLGGPMMGNAVFNTDVPILKGTGAIIALTENEIKSTKATVCMRCGKCVDTCPLHLQPLMLRGYAINKDYANLKKYHILDCMECGACAYICPGRQNPVQYIRNVKPKVAEMVKRGDL